MIDVPSCQLYGLTLSVNVPLAALSRLPPSSQAEVQVWFGTLPSWYSDRRNVSARPIYTSQFKEENGEAALNVFKLVGDDYFEFVYADGTIVVVDRSGSQIWAQGPDLAAIEDTATYVLGPVLGFVLRLRGNLCLHASAVAIAGQAIAFLGPPGAGKSTTAALFAKMGYPVLTDDVTSLSSRNRSFIVFPGYPRLNLWPESSLALFGSADNLPFITPNWDKRYLDLMTSGYHFQPEPLSLAAIYILDDRCDDHSAPFIKPVSAADSLMLLIANSSTNYLLDTKMRANEFETLTQVVEAVPLRRVIPHSNPTRLSRLSDVILADLQTLSSSSACRGDESCV